MGLAIKRNAKGLYKAKSTISDESVSDVWLTEDEFKRVLIVRSYWRFIEETIKIDLEFPSGYYVNDSREWIDEKAGAGSSFLLENWKKANTIEEKYREIIERLKIEL